MHHDFTKFNALKPRLLEAVDRMLAEDISRLMAYIPHENTIQKEKGEQAEVKGGAFEGVTDQASPFGFMKGEGIDAGAGEPEWIVGKDRYKWDNVFDGLNPIDGKITGAGKSTNQSASSFSYFIWFKLFNEWLFVCFHPPILLFHFSYFLQ